MPTALITGATAGLGAAFARRLAREQHSLVLVARDAGRLEQTAKELEAEHGVPVELIPADLITDDGVAEVAERLADPERPVDLLVNNAGMGLGGSFVGRPVDASVRLTRLNVLTVLRLAHAALTPMLARGRGDILNVSSVAGFTPGSRDPAYAASKAWVTAFSEALRAPTRGTGVRVLALCPGFVRTEFHERASINMAGLPDWMWTDADDVVSTGLHALRRGKAICIPGRQYQAIVAVARHAPRELVRRGAARMGARTT